MSIYNPIKPSFYKVLYQEKAFITRFILIYLVGNILARLLNIDKFIFGLMGYTFADKVDMSRVYYHYKATFIILLILFLVLPMLYRVFVAFVKTLTNPHFSYGDCSGIRYLDLPAIPDEDKVYQFMGEADEMHAKGGRLDEKLRRKYNVDRYGRIRGQHKENL